MPSRLGERTRPLAALDGLGVIGGARHHPAHDVRHAAGAVRDDIHTGELIALIVGASRAAEYASQDPHLQDRAIAVILDGLRPRA